MLAGKRGYAGKTGTSRDGWFVGFTPELICVVYVGFDDGSNLNLKGSDSAMPIWAEFMRETLRLHPEWNGDWVKPDSDQTGGNRYSKREFDSRNVTRRRLFGQRPARGSGKESRTAIHLPLPGEAVAPKSVYVDDVPKEFRRIEYFISGTIPNRALVPILDDDTDGTGDGAKATPTPFTTWEDAQTGDGIGIRSEKG